MLKEYIIVNLKKDEYNISVTDDYVSDITNVIDTLSNDESESFSIVSNMDLFNQLLYRKVVSTFIKDIDIKSNITYNITLTHGDDKHILLIRNNAMQNSDNLYVGIQGIIYGTTIN